MNKYQIIEQYTYLPDGRKVYRILALRDFGTVRRGTIGGFVESENNLSDDGRCWIADDAIAAGKSRVSGDSLLANRAMIDDYAKVTDNAAVRDDATLRENVFVYGNATVGLQSVLAGVATVCDHALILCNARRSNSGRTSVPNVQDDAIIRGLARLEGKVLVKDYAVVEGNAIV